MNIKILIVEDDASLCRVLIEAATIGGYVAEGVNSAEAALKLVAEKQFDIVVTDVTLPGMSGIDLLPQLRRLRPAIIPIVITAYGTIDTAVEAMKRGAIEFLTKPVALDALISTLQIAAQRVNAQRALTSVESRAAQGNLALAIIAKSAVMRQLLEQVSTIAPYNTTILITGETGTGKEMVAREIHLHSTRHKQAMVALNCAAIPEQLLEDELFGHVRGAFTGALNAREGRFEQANGSTLFLDEIGDMSLPLQSKFLRVLQEREFEKLGSSRTVKVDVRIVAATSANLERRIEENSFRPDLYYRLNVVHLRIPPLAERPDDIRPLAEFLLERFTTSVGLPAKIISEAAWSALHSYRFPGNVRQLQNAMERAAALSGGRTTIDVDDLPEEVRGGARGGVTPVLQTDTSDLFNREEMPDEGVSFDSIVTKVERDLLLQSLNKTGGNKMRAAKLLNMKRTTFVEKLKRLDITDAATDDEE